METKWKKKKEKERKRKKKAARPRVRALGIANGVDDNRIADEKRFFPPPYKEIKPTICSPVSGERGILELVL